jgi:hypothetical protein
VAVICVLEFTEYEAAAPLKATFVALLKFEPEIVTFVPAPPLDGLKPVIVGDWVAVVTVNDDALVACPALVVTVIGPLVAADGTTAVIWVLEATLKLADVPLKATTVAPEKFAPEIVTVAPTGPCDGAKPVIEGGCCGGAATVNDEELTAVPLAVWTVSGPVVAPEGTDVVIWVLELTL